MAESKQNYKLTVSVPPDEERIYRIVTNFIKSAKNNLVLVTKSLSSDILAMILNKIDVLEDITVVTNERHQINIKDSLKCFDILEATPKIHHLYNSNVNSTFIIKDKVELLLLTSTLINADLKTKLNLSLEFKDPKIVQELWKFYKNHLPSFMR